MNFNSQSPQKVENPKLTLFAFHLCQELTQQQSSDREEIWQRFVEIGKQLDVSTLQNLPQLLNQNQSPQTPYQQQNIITELLSEAIPSKILNFSLPQPEDSSLFINGEIYPQRIHDTYTIDFTLRYPQQKVTISELKGLNPEGCLLPSSIQASLGHTLMLFATPLESSELTTLEIAEQCVDRIVFATKIPIAKDCFKGKGKFLEGDIFEYQRNSRQPHLNEHILIWFANHPQTKQKEAQGNYYRPLIKLLCAYHKIQFVYAEARDAYFKARKLYEELEHIVDRFANLKSEQDRWLDEELKQLENQKLSRKQKERLNSLLNSMPESGLVEYLEQNQEIQSNPLLRKTLQKVQEKRLQMLETWLVQMPKTAVDYARSQRDIQAHLTTIEINTRNYKNELDRLQSLSLADDDLEFWKSFYDRECPKYSEQLRYDLEYLASGKVLFDQILEGIRGLVEIDGQKQSLANDVAEKERDRNLEIWFTVAGSGLAVSGLSSQIQPTPVKEVVSNFYPNFYDHWLNKTFTIPALDILFHIFIGFIFAVLVKDIIEVLIRGFSRDNRNF